MDVLSIRCAGCEQTWSAALPFSVYERQALESCPCPRCGSYTLCCAPEPAEDEGAGARALAEAAF